MICDLSSPPAQYDAGPIPHYIVRYLSEQEMDEFARPFKTLRGRLYKFCGFSDVKSQPMVIYLRRDLATPQLLRHELGHLRGWRHPSLLLKPLSIGTEQ